jgi:hypothetical protein
MKKLSSISSPPFQKDWSRQGLGLSNDTLKAHGAALRIDSTRQEESTTFIIQLPLI